LQFQPQEKPIIAQIFGKNVESFKRAAKICEDMGFDGIDLNMGCPAKKVVRSEHGIALRNKPDLAYKLIEAVANSTKLPVSVKTRLGWSNADDLLEFGLGAEQAGCNMLAIHGRTFKEPYKVPAHFEPIYELKKQLKIPVLGNGGITSMADGMTKLNNLDGFLIGQASFGNPWVFSTDGAPQKFFDKINIIKKHAELLFLTKGEKVGSREIRKHLVTYTKNFCGAREYRRRLVQVTNLEEIYGLLDEIGRI
jgi:nifR3 family TIM-barrel protein